MTAAPGRLVVVGNGMVGQRFVDEMIDRQAEPQGRWHVTVIGEEATEAYDRVALSSWFDGASTADLIITPVAQTLASGADVRLSTMATAIDPTARTISLDDGTTCGYDHLVLATGSRAFIPPVAGADLPGCFPYRTLDDLESIGAWAAQPHVTTGVVIGGGLLGLEAANALRTLGLTTSVIEMADRLMPQQLDSPAAAMLERWVHALDGGTHLGFATDRIVGDERGVRTLIDADGNEIQADIVVFSAGIRPRHELAEACGLEIGPRGGVVVDDRCRTSDDAISAIGEVACHDGRVYGLVAPGYSMAATVAAELSDGAAEPFTGAEPATKLKLLGVEVATFGDPFDDEDDRIDYSDPFGRVHRRISVRDGVVIGGVLVGDASNHAVLAASVGSPAEDTPLAALVLPAGVADVGPVELPDSALLCTCNSVTSGDVRAAVADGCHTSAAITSCTSAGAGCGGCVPDVVALLRTELDRLGVAQDRALMVVGPTVDRTSASAARGRPRTRTVAG